MASSKRIMMIGFPRSGKSVIGEILAKRLDIPWFDLDHLLIDNYEKDSRVRQTCAQIWEKKGESFFRALEAACLNEFLDFEGSKPSWLLSLGGGAPLHSGNQDRIQSFRSGGQGHVLYLNVTARTLWERMEATHFPQSLDQENLAQSFQEHYSTRNALYQKLADIQVTIDQQDKETILEKIIQKLK